MVSGKSFRCTHSGEEGCFGGFPIVAGSDTSGHGMRESMPRISGWSEWTSVPDR